MASISLVKRAIALALYSLWLKSPLAFAQNCYYPNGDLSTGSSREAACSSDSSMCCPLDWECMSDGLCYLPTENIYGRYSCTDRSWGSSCPEICTHNNTANGAEAILQCSNGKWCCDGNRSWNCCTTSDTVFFELDKPNSIASVTALSPVSQVASNAHNPPPSTTDAKYSSTARADTGSTAHHHHSQTSMTSAKSHTSHTKSPATVTHKAVTTGKDGSVSTITEVTTLHPSATGVGTDRGHATSHSSSNLGMIIGIALGVPLFLIICAVLAFCLYRRHRKNKRYSNLSQPMPPPMEANYANLAPGAHAAEIAGYPVAAKRTKSGRKSELHGNDTYIYSPNPSVRTNETSPPQYSPARDTPTMPHIQEEPAELWGGYIPYRPPNAGSMEERKSNEQS